MFVKQGQKLAVGIGVAMLFLVVAGTATVMAADSAAPGDILYPVDLLAEDVQRVLTMGKENKTEFEMQVLDERKTELEEMGIDGGVEGISTAIEKIQAQEERVQTRVREVAENAEADEGVKERIMTRSQEQVQEHTQTLEQVKEQLQEKSMDKQAEEIEQVQEQYKQRGGSGGSELDLPGNQGKNK